MKYNTMKTLAAVLAICFLAAGAALGATLAEIDHLEPGEIATRGFELEEAQKITIAAVSYEREKDFGLWRGDSENRRLVNAWILDSKSREVVWSMAEARPDQERHDLAEYQNEVYLEAGTYEVYYATRALPYREDGEDHGWWSRLGRAVEKSFDAWGDYEDALGDLHLAIDGNGRKLDEAEIAAVRGRWATDALVSFTELGDSQTQSRGFELDEEVELEIYALGEVMDENGYDYGWIVDTATRERVWTFTERRSDPAGGARKNRVVRDTVTLPAGKYAAFFVTDDSHSAESWNNLPPYDPFYWGLMLKISEPGRRQLARTFEYREFPEQNQVIVELTSLRDDDYASAGFTLERPLDVRVYAVGEGWHEGMADYGWIVDATTRETVWSMERRDTRHAGGDEKNRVADEVLRLEPGSYLVSFVTDDSHSYRDWNAAAPMYPERWGISLFAANEDFDPAMVSDYDESEDASVLVRINRVRDGRHQREELQLEQESKVSIYALGEGDDDRMYDYAWIEDEKTGHVVWEMDYRETDEAGGADKNRVYRGQITLPAGEYTVHYETDGSHSFGDWNAAPPRDPESWGVVIAQAR